MTDVLLLSRPGCHLCDRAREVVAEVAARTGTAWREVDVDSDPGWRTRYGEEVPVVLLDGVQHSYFTVDADRLEAALTR